MLTIFLRLLGEENIQSFKGHVHDLVEGGSARFRRELRDVGLAVVFMALGALAAAATVGIGIAALYDWIERYYGPLAALLAIGCLTAILAAVMFAMAWLRTSKSGSPRNPSKPAPPTSRPHEHAPPAVDPSALHPLPANASVADVLAHRFAHRAVAASDEAIDRAAELVREGSSGALVGTLAIAMLIGLIIGQRGLYNSPPAPNTKGGPKGRSSTAEQG